MRSRRLALLGATALFGIFCNSLPSFAQDIETITVTGSRIATPELDMPNPVQSVTAADLLHSGDTNITDYLKRLPALVGSLGDADLNGSGGAITDAHASIEGLNLLSLRNLGYARTLVLEDGQRIVGSVPGTAAVDTNSIPVTLIDRVDVSTGGSSAVYGADGVSGVVNFIMKHDLEGVSARAQVSEPQDPGGSDYLAAVSVGHNFDESHGNITLTYEGFVQKSLFYTQREATKQGGYLNLEPNPANPTGSDPTLPAELGYKNATIPFLGGAGLIDTLDGQLFNGNGSAFQHGIPVESGDEIGGDGLPSTTAGGGDFAPIEHRHVAQIGADEEFNKYFKLSGEFRYSHVDTKTVEEPAFWEDIPVTDQNPFLPANVRDAISNNGFVGAGPDGSSLGLNTEFPYEIPGTSSHEKTTRDVYRGVIGLNGELPLPEAFHNAKYDIHYVYGQTDVRDNSEGDLAIDRLVAAMDVITDPSSGSPVCRSNIEPTTAPPDLSAIFGAPILDGLIQYPSSLFGTTFTPGANSGCSPFNPYDPKANNKAALKFIEPTETTTSELTQQDLNGFVSFDFPQVQDWGFGGPVSVVLGGEWRQETSKSVSPAITVATGGAPSPFFGQGGPEVKGQFHVSEGFAEVKVPVLADRTLVKELTFDFAGRVSNYSTAGTDESWTLSGVYSPISGIKFRGSDAYSVRAPNIGELYSPQQVVFQSVGDPCDAANVSAGTSFREANCVAVFNKLGVPYMPGVTETTSSITPQVNVGGNPDLKPETARTLTLGAVIQPDFLPGLSATVDWYRVKIAGAIESLSASTIANQCVDQSTINNAFCSAITRTTMPLSGEKNGQITFVSAQELNVSQFSTQGEDFTVSYHADTKDWFAEDYGTLDFHLIGSHLDSFTTTELKGQAAVKWQNYIFGGLDGGPTPDWQFNLDTVWTFGQWQVDYDVQWYDKLLNFSRQTVASEPNIVAKNLLYTSAQDLHSIQVSYDFDGGWEAYAGINNLWYQRPSATNTTYPVDPIGRVFYVGLKADLSPW